MSDITDITGPMIGIGGLVVAAGTVGGLVEVLLWLRHGVWMHHDLLWVVGTGPVTQWGGVDQMISWLWVQPLWGIVSVAGFALALTGVVLEKS